MTPLSTKGRLLIFLMIVAIVALGICVAVWVHRLPNSSAIRDVPAAKRDLSVDDEGNNSLWPLPPEGMSLGSSYRLLAMRTNAGDGVAAKRLFNEVSECLRVDRLDAFFKKAITDKSWILNNPQAFTGFHGDSATDRTQALDQIENELDEIKESHQLCAAAPKRLDDGRIYQIALDAARAGDTRATACLLMAPYKAPSISDRQGKTYSNEVMALATNAIEGGDWNVALAMTYVYNGMPHEGYSGYVTFVNPEKELAYSELVRMGVPNGSPDAKHLDRRLGFLLQAISPEQKAAALDWARQTYARYFVTSGPVFSDSLPCNY